MNVHIKEVKYSFQMASGNEIIVKLCSDDDGKKLVRFFTGSNELVLDCPYNELAYIFDKLNKVF